MTIKMILWKGTPRFFVGIAGDNNGIFIGLFVVRVEVRF